MMDIMFASAVAILHFVATLIMNKYGTEKKAPKHMLINSCLVFLSVIGTSYAFEMLGLGIQKGGSKVAAFTSKPEF